MLSNLNSVIAETIGNTPTDNKVELVLSYDRYDPLSQMCIFVGSLELLDYVASTPNGKWAINHLLFNTGIRNYTWEDGVLAVELRASSLYDWQSVDHYKLHEFVNYFFLIQLPRYQPYSRDDFTSTVELSRKRNRLWKEKEAERLISPQAFPPEYMKNKDKSVVDPVGDFQELEDKIKEK